MRKYCVLLVFLILGSTTSLWAQQPVVVYDPLTHAAVPTATTTEATQDGALGTITLVKFLLDGCRGRDTVPSAVSTADDAVLGLCNLLGARAVFPMANSYGGADTCYLTSAASNNSTNCKASAGTIYDISVVNTTATLYYLRLYNAGSAPTCSSATNFVESIPIPASTTGAGIVRTFPTGRNYSAGIGFCLTAGGSSTDNSNAATGVYTSIGYK